MLLLLAVRTVRTASCARSEACFCAPASRGFSRSPAPPDRLAAAACAALAARPVPRCFAAASTRRVARGRRVLGAHAPCSAALRFALARPCRSRSEVRCSASVARGGLCQAASGRYPYDSGTTDARRAAAAEDAVCAARRLGAGPCAVQQLAAGQPGGGLQQPDRRP